MDRHVFSLAAVALIVLGVCMVIWPGWIALKSRDDGDPGPPTAGEACRMRVLGVTLIAGGGYALYALLTSMPGAEFFPA